EAPSQDADAGVAAVAEATEEPAPPDVTAARNRAQVHYVFQSRGGGLQSAELQGKKMREQAQLTLAQGYKRMFGGEVPQPPQMNLAQPVPGAPLPLALDVISASGNALV